MKCIKCSNLRSKDLPYCRRHQKQRQMQRAIKEGWTTLNLVPVAEVVAHLDMLRDSGLGWSTIAEYCSMQDRHLRNIRTQKYVHPSTAARILAVPITAHGIQKDKAVVDSLGTMRRLQSLQAMGYTNAMLGDHIGIKSDTVVVIINNKTPHVRAETARRVHEVFNTLQLVYPPDTYGTRRAKLRAQRKGWDLPMAWDEDTIDDPNAEPMHPDVHKDAWWDDYLELRSLGKTDEQIAERIGIKYDSLMQRVWRRRRHASTSSDQEHQQVREGDEQMVRADRQGMAAI